MQTSESKAEKYKSLLIAGYTADRDIYKLRDTLFAKKGQYIHEKEIEYLDKKIEKLNRRNAETLLNESIVEEDELISSYLEDSQTLLNLSDDDLLIAKGFENIAPENKQIEVNCIREELENNLVLYSKYLKLSKKDKAEELIRRKRDYTTSKVVELRGLSLAEALKIQNVKTFNLTVGSFNVQALGDLSDKQFTNVIKLISKDIKMKLKLMGYRLDNVNLETVAVIVLSVTGSLVAAALDFNKITGGSLCISLTSAQLLLVLSAISKELRDIDVPELEDYIKKSLGDDQNINNR